MCSCLQGLRSQEGHNELRIPSTKCLIHVLKCCVNCEYHIYNISGNDHYVLSCLSPVKAAQICNPLLRLACKHAPNSGDMLMLSSTEQKDIPLW